MKRLNDLEHPHKEDSPLFLVPRPNNNQQENREETEKKASNPIPTPLTETEKAKVPFTYYVMTYTVQFTLHFLHC